MADGDYLMAEVARSRSIFSGAGRDSAGSDLNIPGLGPLGAMMTGPLTAPLFKAAGLMPAQFMPTQGLYDQIQAKRTAEEMAIATSRAAATDRATYVDMIRATAKLTGQPFGADQEKAAGSMADDVVKMGPMLMGLFGPQMYDDLHGSRGSAAAMAQGIARGGAYGLDPVTGRTGLSGASSGAISAAVHSRFFGPSADPASFRGLSAGRVGMMYDELQLKGLVGPSMAALSPEQQRSALAADPEALQGSMAALRAAKPAAYEGLVADMERRRPADKGLRALAPAEMDRRLVGDEPSARHAVDVLQKEVPGEMADVRRKVDAKKVGDRLQSMSGTVAAMRDIFGDAGHPNAPMRELIEGLEKLTQGGTATMSAGQMEKSVRMTEALAKSTGVGIDGMLGMMAHGASRAESLGLERTFAVQATQGAVAFGQAFGQVGRSDVANFQGRSKDEMTMTDQNLRLSASGSGLANQLGATVRSVEMLKRQGITVTGDAVALADAIKARGQTFTDSTGRTRSIFQSQDEWKATMRDSKFDDATISQMTRQRAMNREPGERYKIGDNVRDNAQGDDIARIVAQEHRGAITSGLAKAGVTGEAASRAAMVASVAAATTLRKMDGGDRRDGEKRDALVADAVKKSLVSQGIDIRQLEPRDLISMANSGYGAISERVKRDPRVSQYGTALGMFELQSSQITAQGAKIVAEKTNDAAVRTALAGLGRAGPVARVVDTVLAAPGTAAEAVGRVMGGVDPAAIRERLTKLKAADPATLKAAGITDKDQLVVLLDQVAKATAAATTGQDKVKAREDVTALVEGGEKARDKVAATLKAGGFKSVAEALSSATLPAAARERLIGMDMATRGGARAVADAQAATAAAKAPAADAAKAAAAPAADAAEAVKATPAAAAAPASKSWLDSFSISNLMKLGFGESSDAKAGAAEEAAAALAGHRGQAAQSVAMADAEKAKKEEKAAEGDDSGRKSQLKITGTLTIPGLGAGSLTGRSDGGGHGSSPIAMT